MADTTETTTARTAEVVRYDDPVIITEPGLERAPSGGPRRITTEQLGVLGA